MKSFAFQNAWRRGCGMLCAIARRHQALPRTTKKRLAGALFLALLCLAFIQSGHLTTEEKIDALIAQMTIEEKVGQLNLVGREQSVSPDNARAGRLGGIMNYVDPKEVRAFQEAAAQSRLKIPLLVALDAVHGFSTDFPFPLSQASSWNPSLIEQSSHWTAREAAAVGINWTFAPMVDLSRDPRWGRVLEGAGEDPYLGSVIAAARTRGYQAGGVAATVKHFVGYGAVEAGREYNAVWIPPAELHDMYLPPFKAAIDAGSMTLMPAFITLDGVPATAHRGLLTDLLRGKWGFDGVVVSDFLSIHELQQHGIAKDDADAAREALLAGVDMDMMARVYIDHLPDEVRAGRVPMPVLDEAVRHVLRLKFRLGLFDKPMVDPTAVAAQLQTDGALQASHAMARESLILLKNDGVLPLSKAVKHVAVIGALNGMDEGVYWTDPAGFPRRPIEALDQALKRLAPQLDVTFAPGVKNTCGTEWGDRDAALRAAREADVIVAYLGEDCKFLDEAASRTNLNLPGVQGDLLRALKATGKPVVLVLATGRPLVLTDAVEESDALIQTFYTGTEGRIAIAETLLGLVNPSGKLTMSMPRSEGQIPVYYNHLPTGRPELVGKRYQSVYIDAPNDPLFPFGFGLSYNHFVMSDVRVMDAQVPRDGTLDARVTIRNDSDVAGQDVVQLYTHQLVASRSRPVRELKAFTKVLLQPHESREVTLQVKATSLGFHDDKGCYRVEPGPFKLYVGDSSLADLAADFELVDDGKEQSAECTGF
ncbi:glycoside hydrolase family 3 N-terminal domain-containing protein [Methylovirgula sp. 4M-Z18]|uniref:glycoside hydrolase family 3 N-terminal domain-containing protein n=1 Tax=Methylovirgula sp. 4M-Z18 TaxID=2293567 RepID=UPI000E2EEB8A|nr:glycoside hydrolase family 3 N-terminal domain-containing protein [Methylovirgula sp. 4M-Z18]RFB81380.1 glycosyl hydrolase [Methylovirgula sp. 4M-Z18]